MARNNFQYEKRQRELEKKRKAEEKARRKQDAKSAPGAEDGQDGAVTLDDEGDAASGLSADDAPQAERPSLA